MILKQAPDRQSGPPLLIVFGLALLIVFGWLVDRSIDLLQDSSFGEILPKKQGLFESNDYSVQVSGTKPGGMHASD